MTDRLEVTITIDISPRGSGFEAVASAMTARGTPISALRCGRGRTRADAVADLGTAGGPASVVIARIGDLARAMRAKTFADRFGCTRNELEALPRDDVRERMVRAGVKGAATAARTVSKEQLLSLLDVEG